MGKNWVSCSRLKSIFKKKIWKNFRKKSEGGIIIFWWNHKLLFLKILHKYDILAKTWVAIGAMVWSVFEVRIFLGLRSFFTCFLVQINLFEFYQEFFHGILRKKNWIICCRVLKCREWEKVFIVFGRDFFYQCLTGFYLSIFFLTILTLNSL